MVKVGDIIKLYENQESYDQYSIFAGECDKLGYRIKEIKSDDHGRMFEVYNPHTIKDEYEKQLNDFKAWFDSEYTYKEQKYRRLMTLNKRDDDGIDAKTKLLNLYEQAELKRQKIQELEKNINE